MDINKPMCTLSTIATNCPINDLIGVALGPVLVIGLLAFIIICVYLTLRD